MNNYWVLSARTFHTCQVLNKLENSYPHLPAYHWCAFRDLFFYQASNIPLFFSPIKYPLEIWFSFLLQISVYGPLRIYELTSPTGTITQHQYKKIKPKVIQLLKIYLPRWVKNHRNDLDILHAWKCLDILYRCSVSKWFISQWWDFHTRCHQVSAA